MVRTGKSSQADSTGVEIPAKGPLAVVCIPGGEFESKRAQMALDFYRGFLIAADTLAGRSGRVDVRVVGSGYARLSAAGMRSENSSTGK